MKFTRELKPLKTNSYFIFWLRGSGKTTLVQKLWQTKKTYQIDLLDPFQEEQYLKNPSLLK